MLDAIDITLLGKEAYDGCSDFVIDGKIAFFVRVDDDGA